MQRMFLQLFANAAKVIDASAKEEPISLGSANMYCRDIEKDDARVHCQWQRDSITGHLSCRWSRHTHAASKEQPCPAL